MRTSVDSSVLWCLINGEPEAPAWQRALERAALDGDLVICPVAFSEIAPAYASEADVMEDLERLTITYDPIRPDAAFKAGQIFKSYRRAGGGPRLALIPDFLIAAHALVQADRLAAVDRGYLRSYFPTLKLLKPLP